MSKVWMGTPTTRDFSAQYVASLLLSQADGLRSWDAVIGQAIDLGRNTVVDRFLRHPAGFEFLLMHDSDATWEPEAINRLASRNLPVVTGVIFKRDLPTVPTIGKRTSTGPNGESMYNFGGTINRIVARVAAEREAARIPPNFPNEMTLNPTDQDIEEIDGCGMHFCMIRRDVLEKMQFPWFTCVTPNGGEDFDFCRKVKKAGFKLFVDYSVFTGHVAGPGIEIGVRQFLQVYNGVQLETVWAA